MNSANKSIEKLIFDESVSVIYKIKQLNLEFDELMKSRKDNVVNDLIEIINNTEKKTDWKIKCYILSFLLEYSGEEQFLHAIMSQLETNPEIDTNEYNFLYWQLTKKLFVTPKLNTIDNKIRLRKIYGQLFNFFNEQLQQTSNWIPFEERDKELVIVIIGQFLSPSHAPTQIALEQCHILIKKFNKKVLLINTADMSRSVSIPYYSHQLWNYNKKYNEINSLTYEGVRIPFYQFTEEMPSGSEMDSVLQTVLQMKPEYILSIGGSNVTADLCSNFVPVVTSPCSVEIPISEGTFLLLPRAITDEDVFVIKNLTQPEDRVIESEISYKSKKSGNSLARADWGIDDTQVLIVIVGNRLNEELSEEFLDDLNRMLGHHPEVCIALVGQYTRVETHSDKYKNFNQRSILMGYQKDLSAVYAICDIYLNPPRKGGGTSAAEALYMGVPAFSYSFGDVSYVVTDKYLIQNLEQVEEYLMNWKQQEFRTAERKLALERAEELFDSSRVMIKVGEKLSKVPAYY